jgi:hypothetical protein
MPFFSGDSDYVVYQSDSAGIVRVEIASGDKVVLETASPALLEFRGMGLKFSPYRVLAGRGAGYPGSPPFRTHRAQFGQ